MRVLYLVNFWAVTQLQHINVTARRTGRWWALDRTVAARLGWDMPDLDDAVAEAGARVGRSSCG